MDMNVAAAINAYVDPIFFNIPFLGEVDVTSYLLAGAFFLILTGFFWLLRHIVLARLDAFAKKTCNDFDDMLIGIVRGIHAWVYTLVALYISLQFFDLPSWADITARGIFLIAIVWQVIDAAVVIVNHVACKFIEKDEDGDGEIDPNSATASHMIGLFSRIILWSVGLLFVLSNLGIEVTSLIAGLGIGGIAIAFALQGILGDLFSSLSIYLDKPFRIGDFIIIGDDMGVVEKIGIKTTRLRTLQGEELVVSNTELTSTRIQNFKKMQERRIVFSFGVTYDTPSEKLNRIPTMVKEIIENISNIRFDRANFKDFGDSALNYEVVYYVLTDDYNAYMDIQEAINLSIKEEFEKEGIEFAYPTRTLRFDSSNALRIHTEE